MLLLCPLHTFHLLFVFHFFWHFSLFRKPGRNLAKRSASPCRVSPAFHPDSSAPDDAIASPSGSRCCFLFRFPHLPLLFLLPLAPPLPAPPAPSRSFFPRDPPLLPSTRFLKTDARCTRRTGSALPYASTSYRLRKLRISAHHRKKRESEEAVEVKKMEQDQIEGKA